MVEGSVLHHEHDDRFDLVEALKRGLIIVDDEFGRDRAEVRVCPLWAVPIRGRAGSAGVLESRQSANVPGLGTACRRIDRGSVRVPAALDHGARPVRLCGEEDAGAAGDAKERLSQIAAEMDADPVDGRPEALDDRAGVWGGCRGPRQSSRTPPVNSAGEMISVRQKASSGSKAI